MGLGPFNSEEDRLDLGREDIDPLDDQHIIGASHDPAHPSKRPPAGTGPRQEAGQVAGPVADDREGLFGQRGDDQFTNLARCYRFKGLRIEDLDQKVVFVDMQAVALPAFSGNARPHDLGETVVIRRPDPQALVDLGAHGLRPGLGAEETVPQGQAMGVDAHLHHHIGHLQGIGGRADQGGGLEILHDLDLAFGVAGRDRDDRGPETLGPVMQTETAGKETVAEGDLDHIVGGEPGRAEDAGHQIRPVFDVVFRIPDHRGHPGGP